MQAKLKANDHEDWSAHITRSAALVLTLVLAALATITYFRPDYFPSIETASLQWLSAVCGRLAIVLGAFWLALPAIERIRRIRGGGIVVIAISVMACVFLIRPRSALILLPFAIVATIALVVLGWFSKPRQ